MTASPSVATCLFDTVGLYWEMEDLPTYLRLLDSGETAAAMEFDGVKRESVKVIILDKEHHL